VSSLESGRGKGPGDEVIKPASRNLSDCNPQRRGTFLAPDKGT